MKNQILTAVLSGALFSSVALAQAQDAKALKDSDLNCLNKVLHDATQTQLEQGYQTYVDQMTSYLMDLPDCINIWVNVNEIKRQRSKTSPEQIKQLPEQLRSLPEMLGTKADNGMAEHIVTARKARQDLVKMTSDEATKQIDRNHEWNLPEGTSQIKPGSDVTNAYDISPELLRQASKGVELNRLREQDEAKDTEPVFKSPTWEKGPLLSSPSEKERGNPVDTLVNPKYAK